MHPEMQKYLDGELAREALSAAAEAELAAWERLELALAEQRHERAPDWLADSVMREVADTCGLEPTVQVPAGQLRDMHDEARPGAAATPGLRRVLDWLVTPRPMQVRPLAAAAAAVLLVVLMQGMQRGGEPAAAVGPNGEPVVYVQFTLTAEGAGSVSVAGDFNDWSVEAGTLRDADGSGVWRGLIAVQPGVHKYMFVVDGEEWVTDPAADRYVDDGFGMRNALLAVALPGEAL